MGAYLRGVLNSTAFKPAVESIEFLAFRRRASAVTVESLA